VNKWVGGSQWERGCAYGQIFVCWERVGWCRQNLHGSILQSFMSTFSSQEKMLFNAGFLHVAFYKVLQKRLIDLGGDTTHLVLTPEQPYPLYYLCAPNRRTCNSRSKLKRFSSISTNPRMSFCLWNSWIMLCMTHHLLPCQIN